MRRVKNIIFDLGGVIIDLQPENTVRSLNQLSEMQFEHIFEAGLQNNLFELFEKGLMESEDFFSILKKELRYKGNNANIIAAWNSMLLGVPEQRLDLLIDLKPIYRTFLLSNTCEPHIASFERDLYIEHGVRNFNDYFDKVYYSCRMGMRKPDSEIFELVVKENDLVKEETIFIDDSEQHVKAAGACGINSYLLPKNVDVVDFIKELNLT
jgi:putative hydrolase of the HAD superfamily